MVPSKPTPAEQSLDNKAAKVVTCESSKLMQPSQLQASVCNFTSESLLQALEKSPGNLLQRETCNYCMYNMEEKTGHYEVNKSSSARQIGMVNCKPLGPYDKHATTQCLHLLSWEFQHLLPCRGLQAVTSSRPCFKSGVLNIQLQTEMVCGKLLCIFLRSSNYLQMYFVKYIIWIQPGVTVNFSISFFLSVVLDNFKLRKLFLHFLFT